MKTYDLIVLGFGKAGKTLAATLAAAGWQVAVVERSNKMYGGTCINIGCIPTKALIHRANLAAAQHNTTYAEQQAYFSESVAAKEQLTAALREKNYHKLADNDRIDVLTGAGRFVSQKVIEITSESGTTRITAPKIVINTGAVTALPPIAGIANNPQVYTSTSILELTQLPHRLTIVGGGYIGLEFAAMYASFGAQVTILEGGAELIPREDRDVADAVRHTLEQQGVRFRFNAHVQAIEGSTVKLTDTTDQTAHTVEGDAVLLATGRKPATEELGIDAAGVVCTPRGAIQVDEHLRTNVEGIYAAGDVTGGLQFTYISLDDFRILHDELTGQGNRTSANRGPVPYSVFIEPALAHVGLHEAEALREKMDIRVNRIALTAVPRAHTLGQTTGFFKAVIENRTDRIVGCTLYGAESGELINLVTLAMKHGLTARDLREQIYTHPSMSEVFNDLFV